jgi:taurine dioxygenase
MSPSTAVTLHIERLTPAIGARVSGVDIAAPLDDATVGHLRRLLLEHKFLLFPDQDLTADTQVAFARRFGELTANHPVTPPLDAKHPEVWQIETRNDQWHTDVTFVERPPAASVLRAVSVPAFGGDTLWGDLEAAYESLTPGLQRLADELVALHDGSDEFADILKAMGGVGNTWDGEVFTGFDPVAHPVVRVHPETGRKSLFVNPGFTRRIAGVSDAESKHLLEIFYAHITKPEHLLRHHWSPGDVAFWDNRSTVHYATYDYDGFHRVMQRVTVAGDRPAGPRG